MLSYANTRADPRVRYLSVRKAMFHFIGVVENEVYLEEYNFDRRAGHVKRPSLSEAWRLLGCAQSATCELEERLKSIERTYYGYEIDEIVTATLNLQEAIQLGDWHSLGYE